ncbi:MAG: diguanylate cyclase [Candidatus Gracilibacteria bacterium]|nr:diguanylate cyclase [Candidatus Gracilibacteria bacterium]
MALGLVTETNNLETQGYEHSLVLNTEQEAFLKQRQAETATFLDEQAGRYLAEHEVGDKLLQPLLEMQELDALTKLLNRSGAMKLGIKSLQETKEKGDFFVAVAIDLDHFKAYNDVLGQKFGDFVLQEVAKGLFQTYSNVASRMGGEELFFVFNVHSKDAFNREDLLQYVAVQAEGFIATIREVLQSALQELDKRAVLDEEKKQQLKDIFQNDPWTFARIYGAKAAIEEFIKALDTKNSSGLKESFYALHELLSPLVEPDELNVIADFLNLAQAAVNKMPSVALQSWVWENKASERPKKLSQIEVGGVTAGALLMDYSNFPGEDNELDEYELNKRLTDELKKIMDEANLIEEAQKQSARNKVKVEMRDAATQDLPSERKEKDPLTPTQNEFVRQRSAKLRNTQRAKLRKLVSSVYTKGARQEEIKETFHELERSPWYDEYKRQLAELRELRKAKSPEAEIQVKLAELKELDPRRKLLKELIENTTEAYKDPLTGVHNRHFFTHESARLFEECREQGKPFSIAMLDLDNFKAVNETFGHFFGDIVLQYSAAVWQDYLKELPGAELVRIGGEEFAIVLAGLDAAQSLQLMEDLRAKHERAIQSFYTEIDEQGGFKAGHTRSSIAAYVLKHKKQSQPVGTLSIGLTLATSEDTSIWSVKEKADKAFKKAKQAGRNRVEKL